MDDRTAFGPGQSIGDAGVPTGHTVILFNFPEGFPESVFTSEGIQSFCRDREGQFDLPKTVQNALNESFYQRSHIAVVAAYDEEYDPGTFSLYDERLVGLAVVEKESSTNPASDYAFLAALCTVRGLGAVVLRGAEHAAKYLLDAVAIRLEATNPSVIDRFYVHKGYRVARPLYREMYKKFQEQ